jgi:hypothetical protein
MINLKRICLICFILAPLVLMAAPPVLAQEKSDQATQNAQQNLALNVSGNTSAICTSREERITLQIARYQNNYDRNQAIYERVKSIVQSALGNLSAKGYDISKLQADLQTLNGYVLTFQRQKAAVISQLQTAQSYACGQSEGQFAQAMAEARQLARQAQETMLTLRTYYQTTIRPDFQALRNQTPSQ